MDREGLNQELGVVEQEVAIEAAELAAIEVELADIEHCCQHGQPVPPARAYRIKVDNQYHEWPKAHITGNQLLHLAGRDGHLVFEVFENFRHGEPELISPHAEANLRKHGVEKFTTAPKARPGDHRQQAEDDPGRDVHGQRTEAGPWGRSVPRAG